MVASGFNKIKTLYSNDFFDLNIGRSVSDNRLLLVKCGINRDNYARSQIHETRFNRELEFVSKLEHPNIAKPVSANISRDTETIIYKYNDSVSLNTLIEDKRIFSINDSIMMVTQLLDALEYLHSHGIVVCNINPGILVTGEKRQLEIIDLGCAISTDDLETLPEGTVVGTFPYLSPEQTGFTEFKIDRRTDIYCAGLILYQLLAGRLPFQSLNNNLRELLTCILKTDIEPIKNIPSVLNEILIKALRPTPSERYQSAVGFCEDLKNALVSFENGTEVTFTVGSYDSMIAINHSRFFVDRELELRILDGGLAQLKKGESSTFLLSGVSGIGKSAIISQFKSKARRKADFVSVKCNRFTPNKPFSVFHQILDDILAILRKKDDGSIKKIGALLNTQFADDSGIICKLLPELAEFFEDFTECGSVEKEADRINHLMLNVFALFLDTTPLILFVDDLQWIDRETFEIILKIRKFRVQCMCIYTIRTDIDNLAVHLYNVPIRKIADRLINILPFNENDINVFVRKQFDTIEGATELSRILYEKSGGNPLVIKEINSYLVSNGFIKRIGKKWIFDLTMTCLLPDKFDAVSLIMGKYKNLLPEEQCFLNTGSLLVGNIERKIIAKVCGITGEKTEQILRKLEQTGFLSRNITGNLNFAYDKLQEILVNNICEENKAAISEKIAQEYESLSHIDKNYLFLAAESLLRSSNIKKTFEVALAAARFAVEKNAFDIAIKHYRTSLSKSEQLRRNGYEIPVSASEIEIELGDALMLSGKNEQALNIFKRVIGNTSESADLSYLQLLFRIGCIYHNTGNHNQAIPYFIQILDRLGLRYPKNRLNVYISIILQLVVKELRKMHPVSDKQRIKDPSEMLKVRVLNKLSGSLNYDDIPGYLYTNFKAVNLADRLVDCQEMAESFALHGIPAYQFFHKESSRRYLEKAYHIGKKILRRDIVAFSELYSGIVSFFSAQWHSAEKYLKSSMNGYQLIGDRANQPCGAVYLWKVYLMKGEIDKARKQMTVTESICEEAGDTHFLHTTLAAECFLDVLQGGKPDEKKLERVELKLEEKLSFQSRIQIGIYLVYIDLLSGKMAGAQIRLESLLSGAEKRQFNCEYIVPLLIVRTELLLHSLQEKEFRITSEKQLRMEFRKCLLILKLASFSYPAYRGSVMRIEARYNLYRNRIRRAHSLFQKAVSVFHALDMQYEKAKTLREYGSFLYEINSPGRARDVYNDAYTLFEKCGAIVDRNSLRDKVSPSTVKRIIEMSDNDAIQKQNENSNQIRFDTLLEVCSSMSQINDIPLLLEQILTALISATGAQYGCFLLKTSSGDLKNMLIRDFAGKNLQLNDIVISQAIIDRTESQKQVVLYKGYDTASIPDKLCEEIRGKSILCTPLFRENKYMGCVYLGNDKVAGLFSESAVKVTQILSAQASILLENALLFQSYVQLNQELDNKIKEQTSDILDKKEQLEESNLKLVESERMKGILTGSLVHDIKNYAAGIEGNLQFLIRRMSDDVKVQRVLDVIGETCSDIVSLASNLLDIAKMDEGKLVVRSEKISMEFIESMAEKFFQNPLFEEKGIIPCILGFANDISFNADSYLLERVFQNICSNAAKYVPKGGRFELDFKRIEDELIISFYSSGTPIPDKERDILFNKYARLESKQSQYSKGLGLFFCKMVMQAHKGRIWAESDETGNYFRLAFPL